LQRLCELLMIASSITPLRHMTREIQFSLAEVSEDKSVGSCRGDQVELRQGFEREGVWNAALYRVALSNEPLTKARSVAWNFPRA
jgi:hypothetical protein